MKKFILLAIAGFIFVGCSTKEIVKEKKPTTSIEQQKQEADKAWKELDKE